ncbi:hypothetical protein ACO0R3_003961 [Hanseniaspora guilliermondii]
MYKSYQNQMQSRHNSYLKNNKTEHDSICIVSVAKQEVIDQSSSDNRSFYLYTLKVSNKYVERRYNDFELLEHILMKLYPTVLFPPMPKKENIVDIVKQQANNSIDITSKTLYSGFHSLVTFKDNLLGYTMNNEDTPEATKDKDDGIIIPNSSLLKDIDFHGVSSKDLKLIRHRCIYFNYLIKGLVEVFNSNININNKILEQFLDPLNTNFTDFVNNIPLISDLLSKDVLCINPKDALDTPSFYQYLPVLSLSECKPFSKFGLSYSKESLNEEEIESVQEDYDTDPYDMDNHDEESSNEVYHGAFTERRDSRNSQNSGFNSGALKTFKSEAEEILLKFIERNDDNMTQTNKLVKAYKRDIILKLKSILKSLNSNLSLFQEANDDLVDILLTYNEEIPGYKYTGTHGMRQMNKAINKLETIIYFKCIEYLNILEDLNNNCTALIKYSKNKIKQKWALKKLIKSQKLKLDQLNKKLESEYLNDTSKDKNDDSSSKNNIDDNSGKPRPVEEGIVEGKNSTNETSATTKLSPFMKKFSGLTTMVKTKYANSMHTSKQDLENKISAVKEVIDNLEKNEECINEDTLYVLKEVYTNSTDLFMKKVDKEIMALINELETAIKNYSRESLKIWENIAVKL